MVDRLESMAILVKAVEMGSLSAAGRALRMPLPTLSRKLSELEARLGAKLVIRTTRRLALTEAGATYVAAARRILEFVEEAEREALGEFGAPRGELVVAAPLMFGRLHVLPLAAEFLDMHPEIRVRLALGDRNLQLVEEHVDVALRIGKLPDSGLIATRVGAMRAVVCASPALLAARGEPSSPQDLAGLPCIGVDVPGPMLEWRFAHGPVAVTPRLVVSNPEAAADAAARGVGIARLLYYQAAEAVAAGRLRLLLRPFEPPPAPVHLVHVERARMPLKLRRFLDFAAPRLRATLERLSAESDTPEIDASNLRAAFRWGMSTILPSRPSAPACGARCERGDDAAGEGDFGVGRRVAGVDDGDLIGVDRHAAEEPVAPRAAAIAPPVLRDRGNRRGSCRSASPRRRRRRTGIACARSGRGRSSRRRRSRLLTSRRARRRGLPRPR